MVLFMSDIGIEIMSTAEKWHVDGTFSRCPKFLKQLLTIHAEFKDELFSCAYMVLPDKDSRTYTTIFIQLKNILDTNGSINVKQIMADFEAALVNQLKTTFFMAIIKGCWFHFNQAIIRKLFNLGEFYSLKQKLLFS